MSLLGCGMVLVSLVATQLATAGVNLGGFGPEHLLLCALMCVFILALTALLVWLHVYFFPIVLDDHGITAYRGPRSDRLEWDEIAGFKNTKQAGIPAYKLVPQNNKPSIVIPKCINGIKEIEDALRKHSISLIELKPASATRERRQAPSVRSSDGYIEVTTEREKE